MAGLHTLQVHCWKVELGNLHDFFNTEGQLIHTQDQRGFYIMLLSRIWKSWRMKHLWRNGNKMGNNWRDSTLTAHGTHVGVLIDLRTCEVELLETKVQIQPENHCNEYLPFFIPFNIKVCEPIVSHTSRDAELCWLMLLLTSCTTGHSWT